jgi:hypothetical protein
MRHAGSASAQFLQFPAQRKVLSRWKERSRKHTGDPDHALFPSRKRRTWIRTYPLSHEGRKVQDVGGVESELRRGATGLDHKPEAHPSRVKVPDLEVLT